MAARNADLIRCLLPPGRRAAGVEQVQVGHGGVFGGQIPRRGAVVPHRAADQHQIAQIAESDADRGTSILKILEALDRSANKLGIRCESYYQYEEMNTVSDVRKVVREYNNIARRQNSTPEFVGERFAARMAERAPAGILIQNAQGEWNVKP